MLCWYTALSRVSDYKHHPTDVLAGAVVGAVRAVLRHWYEADGRLDLEAAGDRALELLEHGVLPPA